MEVYFHLYFSTLMMTNFIDTVNLLWCVFTVIKQVFNELQ